jgi:uncharacterized membrane protein
MRPALTFVARLEPRWRDLRYGFLFFPGLVALLFVGLALLLVRIDRLGGAHGLGVGFGGDAPAARSVLSSIAASLITVAGLTFSITIVTLQLVSQQFTPRALRNFLGDRLNQLVAGSFVGIFAYCLLVLRAVRDATPTSSTFNGFVPALSVTLAIVLGLATLALLLVFIHHVSRSIQVSAIASSIGQATLDAVEALYPSDFGRPAEQDPGRILHAWQAEAEPTVVRPMRPGYVQAVALEAFEGQGTYAEWKIHVRVVPGDFATPETALLEAWPPRGEEVAVDDLRGLVAVEDERDLAQDALYGIRQLTDIAVRALSPSTNDPTTAVTCIGYVQAVLERLAGRAFPPRVRRLESTDLVANRHEFEDFVDVGLRQIAAHSRGEERVVAALREGAASIARRASAAGAHDRAAAVVAAITEALERDGASSPGARRTSARGASTARAR